LIVTDAKSDIRSLADIKGKRFSFGPEGDAVLHVAAVDALARGGVKLDDIAKELLPLPGSLQHHVSGLEAAKAVAFEPGINVGVVDKMVYESWPEQGGSLLPLKFSRGLFRVLGETIDVPELALVASTQADPALVDTVKQMCMGQDDKTRAIFSPLGLDRFASGDPEQFKAFLPIARKVLALDEAIEEPTPSKIE
jgi:ABC-type nitrate/sulfonate/bicarbonate transport system substrate-binding protein